MAWLRIDDRLAMSVKVRGLVEEGVRGPRAKAQRNEALGHWLQILSWVAGECSDGFVTADIVEEYGTASTTARLLRARYGRAPLLHRRDEGGTGACPCLAGRAWPADYDYAVHDYLDRNPSRSENDVHRAKARELRDPKLKAAVAARDRDLCRYCGVATRLADKRGELGRTFDHVDPEVADGADNLVVACRGCNTRKARRTPEQAGMVLLPCPGPTGGAVVDLRPDLRPDSEPFQNRIQNGFKSGLKTVSSPDPSPVPGPGTDLCPDPAQDPEPFQVPRPPGTGRDGPAADPVTGQAAPAASPRRVGPPDTPRGPLHGNPYLRQSRPVPEAAAASAARVPAAAGAGLHAPHEYAPGAGGACGLCPLPAEHLIHARAPDGEPGNARAPASAAAPAPADTRTDTHVAEPVMGATH